MIKLFNPTDDPVGNPASPGQGGSVQDQPTGSQSPIGGEEPQVPGGGVPYPGVDQPPISTPGVDMPSSNEPAPQVPEAPNTPTEGGPEPAQMPEPATPEGKTPLPGEQTGSQGGQ